MEPERYRIILVLQYFLLFVDLFLNSFTELFRTQNVILLVLYVIQDICIIFAIIVLFLTFFNTYIFQAGLVSILINKFKMTIIVTLLYLIICIGLHVYSMTLRWQNVERYVVEKGFWALFGIQRIGAVFYYYFYKRTAIVLGDSKFYEDSKWIHTELMKRR